MLGLSSVVTAQQAPANAGASATQSGPITLEEVTVTGSRIKRTTDFNTPTPTTVIDAETMESLGIVNVGQAIEMAPANISQFTPANTGNSSFFTGAYIPDLRGLNPYFGSRTLTLINTQRAVQTGQGDQFDLNFIPQILVQRIDTVTGGASAAYGSGAIAGVINVILDNKLEGGKLNADAYQTSHSDGRDRHIGAAYGHGLLDDRIHFVVGGEYEKQDGIGCQTARSWCARDVGLYQTGTVGANIATYSLGSDLRNNVISPAGAFLSPTLSANTLQVTPDGTNVMPYLGGTTTYSPIVNNTTVEGGQGEPIYTGTLLSAPVTRGVLTGMLTAKITDNINFNLSVNWGRTESTAYVQGNNDQPTTFPQFGLTGQNIVGSSTTFTAFGPTGPFPVTVPTQPNAYIVNNGALLGAVNGGYYNLNKDWNTQVPLSIQATTSVRRFVAGLNGQFGDSSWTWDGYAEYGLTHREQYQAMERHAASYQMALDSVLVNGQPECRVTAAGGVANVANPANRYFNPIASYASNPALYGTNQLLATGCVPLNPFGTQPISQQALDYAFGYLDERLRYEQTVVAFNTSGDIWQGIGAGAFSLATGLEWRQEVGHNDEVPCAPGDAVCEARIQDFAAQYGTPFGGMVTVEEAYLEANLPLAKDLPGAHLVEVNVAGRESRYENKAQYGLDVVNGIRPESTHNLTTWKASLIYEPIDGVRFRGSQSRDSRAANFRELYYGQVLQSGNTGGFGYCSHPTSANLFGDPCTVNLFGNTDLRPETSDTTTLGLVLRPSFVQGLQFSADWFHIRIKNAISAASLGQVELACTNGDATACSQFVFNNNSYLNGAVVPAGTPGAVTGAAAWQAGNDNANIVNAYAFNGAFYDTRGIDFSLNYLASLPDGSSLILRALATWTGEQKYQEYAGGPVFNTLGQTGAANNFLNDVNPAPRWQGNVSITWTKGGFSLTPNMRWVGHGTLNYAGVTPQQTDLYNKVVTNDPSIRGYGLSLLPFNYVPSYFVFGLNGTYSFENIGSLKGLQVFAQVNNLFNRAPPFASSPGGFNSSYAGTNPIFYDTVGLATRVGFRLSF